MVRVVQIITPIRQVGVNVLVADSLIACYDQPVVCARLRISETGRNIMDNQPQFCFIYT